jgi:hypothetical protein
LILPLQHATDKPASLMDSRTWRKPQLLLKIMH